jgi:hypothetical protein
MAPGKSPARISLMRKFLVASVFLVAAGCIPGVEVMRLNTNHYPPIRHEVVVSRGTATRPFVEVAELRTPRSNSAVIRLINAAIDLGADEIVLGPAEQEIVGPSPAAVGLNAMAQGMNPQVYMPPPGLRVEAVITATAIRWKDRPE